MKIEDKIKKMTSTMRNSLWIDLCKLKGHAPYNTPRNLMCGDAYFSSSLKSKYLMSDRELNEAFSLLRSEREDPGRTTNFKEVLPTVEANGAGDFPKLHVIQDKNWGKKDGPRKHVRPKTEAKWGTNAPKRYEAVYRIDLQGRLMTKRAGRYMHQPCPHAPHAGRMHCGDACPHFREPIFREAQVHIPICMGTVLICHVKNFRDDRSEETE